MDNSFTPPAPASGGPSAQEDDWPGWGADLGGDLGGGGVDQDSLPGA